MGPNILRLGPTFTEKCWKIKFHGGVVGEIARLRKIEANSAFVLIFSLGSNGAELGNDNNLIFVHTLRRYIK